MAIEEAAAPPVRKHSPVKATCSVAPADRPPTQEIQDWLLAMGKRYDEHKETLREEHIREVLKNSSAKPKIDAGSADLMRHDGRDVWLRMKIKDREAKAKINDLKARKEEKEAKQTYSFHPSISKHADAKQRKDQYRLNVEWQERKQNRLAKEQKKVEGDVEATKKEVEISQRSRMLAEKIDRNGMSIEDWLIFTDRQKKLKLWHMLDKDSGPKNPKITGYAARLQREGDVSERLYASRIKAADQKEMDSTQNSQASKKSLLLSPASKFSSSTGKLRGMKIEDALLDKWKEDQAKFELRMLELEEEEGTTFKPKINPVSKELAESLLTSSKDRLYSPGTSKRASQCKNVKEEEYSFQPSISQKSRQINDSKIPAESFDSTTSKSFAESRTEVWERRKKEKQDNLARLKKEAENKLMAECTFTPNKTKPASTYVSTKKDEGGLTDRSYQWLQKKEHKILKEQRKKYRSEMDDCTFHPTLSRPSVPPSQTRNYGSVEETPGFEDFMIRQEMARKAKEESKKCSITGANWTPHITIPLEFSFARKGRGDPRDDASDPSLAQRQIMKSRQLSVQGSQRSTPAHNTPHQAWGDPNDNPQYNYGAQGPITPPFPPGTPSTPWTGEHSRHRHGQVSGDHHGHHHHDHHDPHGHHHHDYHEPHEHFDPPRQVLMDHGYGRNDHYHSGRDGEQRFYEAAEDLAIDEMEIYEPDYAPVTDPYQAPVNQSGPFLNPTNTYTHAPSYKAPSTIMDAYASDTPSPAPFSPMPEDYAPPSSIMATYSTGLGEAPLPRAGNPNRPTYKRDAAPDHNSNWRTGPHSRGMGPGGSSLNSTPQPYPEGVEAPSPFLVENHERIVHEMQQANHAHNQLYGWEG